MSHSEKVPEPEFELGLHKEGIRPVRSLGSGIVPAGSRAVGAMEVPGGRHAAPLPATLFSGAVGGRDGRLGTLEGSRCTWRLPLLPGPLPMEAIEKMASLCMRDPDEDEEEVTDEEDVEADDDLLVSVQRGAGGFLPLLPHPLGTRASLWPCVPAGGA